MSQSLANKDQAAEMGIPTFRKSSVGARIEGLPGEDPNTMTKSTPMMPKSPIHNPDILDKSSRIQESTDQEEG